MKRAMIALLLACLVPAGVGLRAGDTGTYRILYYRVDLTPRSDGTVAIDCHQRWLVTGGRIPWITVGTPNSNFVVTGSGGAVVDAFSASEGGWSGVRLDLDRDYGPGEIFQVGFSIVQRSLFYADKERYGLDFTPGWYDRAATDTLVVGVRFFADPATVAAEPPPTNVSGDVMEWRRYGLGKGERFSIHVSFPIASVPGGMDAGNLKGVRGGGAAAPWIVAVAVLIAVALFIVVMARLSGGRGYSGGRIFYGGVPGGRPGARGGGGRRSGGGGGFGGASMSCACACVSCACACACAGGGGAGCSRKTEHRCPICGEEGTR